METKYCLSVLFVSLAACQPDAGPDERARSAGRRDERPVVLFVGTSLTAGYGLDPDRAFPALIQRKIDSAGLRFRVVNAGVSGETSAGALRRIDWLLEQHRPAVVVLETGANDGLRGQHPDTLRSNLKETLLRAAASDPPPQLVLLAMEALPNLGERYASRFREVYPAVAQETGAVLVPFFLAGVAGVESLNQADGIHPTARGQERAAERVWEVLGGVLAGGNGAAGQDQTCCALRSRPPPQAARELPSR